jgi:hypothetical protein
MPQRRSAVIALVATFLARHAHAEVSEVATARQLAISGIDAVESGDCKKGEPLLDRAEKLHHASVHLQYLARCRAGSGRLVAATEMWRQIIREGAPPGASPAVLAALSEATTELERTLPRLATTTVRVAAEYKGLELRLDGVALPAEIVGTPQVLDPGAHELTAHAPGFAHWSKQWSLPEGGTADLVIELGPAAPGEESGAASGAAGAGPGDQGTRKSWVTPAGWVTASVGVAALIGGTVTLLARNSRREELANNCTKPNTTPGGQPLCWSDTDEATAPPGSHLYTQEELESDKQTVRDLTTATNVLFISGGVLLAGGVTMIVLGRTSSSDDGPHTALLAGAPGAPAGLTLNGSW